MFNWSTHLCEYYGVSEAEALELGTRKSGRRPDLPGSKTCHAVSGKTFEEIWELQERKSKSDIFKFYKDQGAWSAFRQCVRHMDMTALHVDLLRVMLGNARQGENFHMCEYGCGVAPIMTTLLNPQITSPELFKNINLSITLCDVDSEHFNFAKYRLNKIKKDLNVNINLFFKEVLPNKLPEFHENLDSIVCFEVLEHVPSPIEVLNNFHRNLNTGGIYIDNFIAHDHDDDDDDGCDLKSARLERDGYHKIIAEKFELLHPTKSHLEDNPNVTRVWKKNKVINFVQL